MALSPMLALAHDGEDHTMVVPPPGANPLKDKRGDIKLDGQEKREARMEVRTDRIQDRGSKHIDSRVEKLRKLEARIAGMKNLSTEQKASLSSSLALQIKDLADLKLRVEAGASSTAIRGDLKDFNETHRMNRLVMPQAAITAASGRILSIVANMEIIGAKIKARIAEAKTAGHDVARAETLYADFVIKIADAKVQAQAAASIVAALKPDGGDASVAESNKTKLMEARAKIKLAQDALKAARADLWTIVKTVRGKGEVKVDATASTTTP
jgi:hypothetical protein